MGVFSKSPQRQWRTKERAELRIGVTCLGYLGLFQKDPLYSVSPSEFCCQWISKNNTYSCFCICVLMCKQTQKFFLFSERKVTGFCQLKHASSKHTLLVYPLGQFTLGSFFLVMQLTKSILIYSWANSPRHHPHGLWVLDSPLQRGLPNLIGPQQNGGGRAEIAPQGCWIITNDDGC